MTAQYLIRMAIAVLPVIAFLASLLILDSFKLVRHRDVGITILVGASTAVVCYGINVFLMSSMSIPPATLARYVGPVVEETAKAIFVIFLLRANRVGFLADATIRGVAIGAGFAVVENLYYMQMRPDANAFIWVIRGFGTALMHGGTTALVAISAKRLLDREGSWRIVLILPGLLLAVVVHGLFNHFFVSPLLSTLIVLVLLPSISIIVYRQSENATREWLGSGFDADRDLLAMISTGSLDDTHIGHYLNSLQNRFPSETVADMLCYLQQYSELAIKAKGLLLMRDAGFSPPPDADVQSQFAELRYLEKTIGVTGLSALRPLLHSKSRDLWQMHFVKE
jgi:protease PrsW